MAKPNRHEIAEQRVERARALRCRRTPAEQVLWATLRDRRLVGLKFRRQHVFGPYVLDFCAPLVCLVVELDGTSHDDDEHRTYDAARTEYLVAHGYRVIRFRNDDVLADLPNVLRRIRDKAHWTGILDP
jgi:adenine-specific DNA-methyltransferase